MPSQGSRGAARLLRFPCRALEALAHVEPDRERPREGRPPKLEPREQALLVEIVLAGPDTDASGISAFTRDDLVRICEERFGKRLAVTTMGSVLRHLGLSRQKARPCHPKTDPAAQAAFKKSPGAAQKNSACA